MYGITAGIVVFILLTNCVFSNTVEKLVDTGFTKQEIQRCACKRMKGKLKCPSGLVPKNDDARQDLMKCLCNHFYKTDVQLMYQKVVQVQPQIRGQEAEQWSTGLCECYKDMGDCCFALCCLPVFTCKVTRAAGACPCLPLLDCISCVPPASLAMRASVRERYGIKGSAWSDCLYGCCCYTLSWLQISRELKRRAASHASSSPSSARYAALASLQGSHLV